MRRADRAPGDAGARLPAGHGRGRRRRSSASATTTACRSSRAAPGTGLSGGALPVADGIVISLARLNRILEVDLERARVVVEPGVTNLEITRAVAADGFYYAPDPSSQQVCTIGGNVAENSGGAHCLKYGFTVNHVLAADVVLPDGEVVTLSRDDEGPDLLGVFVGSEGTLGIAVRVTVNVVRVPESVRTLLAAFESTDAAGEAVSRVIAAGILPAAIEMMDALTLEAVEAAVAPGYPAGAGRGADRRARRARRGSGRGLGRRRADLPRVRLVRAARRGEPRGARADLARPQVVVRGDGPDLAELLRAGRRRPAHPAARGAAPDLRARRRVRAADRERLPRRRREPAPAGALRRQLSRASPSWPSGSRRRSSTCASTRAARSPGEHGVGVDKACSMPKLFGASDLAVMQRLRDAFDPEGLANPGKVLPDAAPLRRGAGAVPDASARAGRGCRASLSPTSVAEAAEVLTAGGTRLDRPRGRRRRALDAASRTACSSTSRAT